MDTTKAKIYRYNKTKKVGVAMDNTMIEKARSQFVRASEEFDFTFISPYCLNEEDGLYAFGYIAEYGSQNGAVIDLIELPLLETNPRITEWCKKNELFVSFISIEPLLGEYNCDYFAELLEDWKIIKFSHCDKNDNYITLHDCKAKRAYFANGVLDFDFDDGFWISPEHPKSHLSEFVRTDYSRVEYKLLEGDGYDVIVFVYERNLFKKTVRKEWSIQKLIDSINSGECVLEFLYQYIDGDARIVECVLNSGKKPYFRECTMKIYSSEVRYYWNNILEDRVW